LALVAVATAISASGASGAADAVAPVRPWKFIIIHHSATRVGNAAAFDAAHRARGMINGLAYHFVIDNGSDEMPDGHIETGERWKTQRHGGHCRQAYINETGIGICLVGDFTDSQPTPKQLDSLVLLIRSLQEQFNIPDDHVLGHGEVIGEFSECPGRQFPWDALKKRLAAPTARSRPAAATLAPSRLEGRPSVAGP
jgi:N-acetyl-anhydromuramyl-L-alanine amidase AmpD